MKLIIGPANVATCTTNGKATSCESCGASERGASNIGGGELGFHPGQAGCQQKRGDTGKF